MNEQVLPSPARAFRGTVAALMRPFLDRGPAGATLRFSAVCAAFLLYWVIAVFQAGFPRVLSADAFASLPFPVNIVLDVALSFVSPPVLMHLIPVIAGFWLALRLGAHYLDDLFELNSPRIAYRYLLGSLFGLNLDTLHVNSGDLGSLDALSPLLRIGGPGYLRVHLGFAAVLESTDGLPRVYGSPSSDGEERVFIQGFERLRDVVDLRDQLRKVDEVRAVTLDGVEIHARDAQMVFRVLSGGRPRNLRNPYPYDENAIRRLVYGQPVDERGRRRWTDALPSLLEREIQAFVGALTIEDFLALQPEHVLAERPAEPGPAVLSPPPEALQIPRRELTRRFHTPEVRSRLEEQGLELVWVGVGTWELRDTSTSVSRDLSPARTLMSTWRDLHRARRMRSAEFQERQRRLRSEELTSDSLQDLIRSWTRSELPRSARPWEVLTRLTQLLTLCERRLLGHSDLDLPIGFEAALACLRRLIEPEVIGGAEE